MAMTKVCSKEPQVYFVLCLELNPHHEHEYYTTISPSADC